MEKVVRVVSLDQLDEANVNLSYWLSREPSERIEAVEILRRLVDEGSARLQRVARVVQRESR